MYMAIKNRNIKKILHYISIVLYPYRERKTNFIEKEIDPCGQIVIFLTERLIFFPFCFV